VTSLRRRSQIRRRTLHILRYAALRGRALVLGEDTHDGAGTQGQRGHTVVAFVAPRLVGDTIRLIELFLEFLLHRPRSGPGCRILDCEAVESNARLGQAVPKNQTDPEDAPTSSKHARAGFSLGLLL
jgi:hypothetical protein